MDQCLCFVLAIPEIHIWNSAIKRESSWSQWSHPIVRQNQADRENWDVSFFSVNQFSQLFIMNIRCFITIFLTQIVI